MTTWKSLNTTIWGLQYGFGREYSLSVKEDLEVIETILELQETITRKHFYRLYMPMAKLAGKLQGTMQENKTK